MVAVIDVTPTVITVATKQGDTTSEPKKWTVEAGADFSRVLHQAVAHLAAYSADSGPAAVLLPPHRMISESHVGLEGLFRNETKEINLAVFTEAFGNNWSIVNRGYALAVGAQLEGEHLQPLDDVSNGDAGSATGIFDIGYDHVVTAVRKKDFTRSLETYSAYKEWFPSQELVHACRGVIEGIHKKLGSLAYDVLLCEKWHNLRRECMSSENHPLFDALQGAILGALLREFMLEHPGVGRMVIMGTSGSECFMNLRVPVHPTATMTRNIFGLGPMFGRESRESLPIFTSCPPENAYVRGGLALATLP